MRIKRFLFISLLFIIAAVAVAVVFNIITGNGLLKAGKKEGKTARTTIDFYHITVEGSDKDRTIRKIIDDFNNSQDKIIVKASSGFSVDKQLVAIMSGKAPDIGHAYWPNLIRWAQDKMVEPLDSYIEKDEFDIEDFLPAAIERSSYEGVCYALPFEINTMALYYNIDMLRENGFDQPPRTMEELKHMAKELTRTDENGEIIRMGFLPDYPWLDNVLWPILFGAEFYDPVKKEVTTTSPDYIRAIEFQNWFYKEWGWNNISKFKLKFGSYEQDPFYSGKLAMVMGGEWVPVQVRKYAPEMNLGVCPFPYPDDNPSLQNTSMITTSVFYIPENAEHKEFAWEFMKYLVSKESMISYTAVNSVLMARKSVLEDDIIKNNPDLKLVREYALDKNIRGFPPLPIADEYLKSLSEQTQMVFKQLKTPHEAMMDVKKEIDPLLSGK